MCVNFTLKHAYPENACELVNCEVNTHLVSEICQDDKKRVNIVYSVWSWAVTYVFL